MSWDLTLSRRKKRKNKKIMQPTIYTFLIVCPLVFLAGFVDAVAGGED